MRPGDKTGSAGRRATLLDEFSLDGPRQQRLDDLARGQAFVEQTVDALADRHIDAFAVRDGVYGSRGEITLYHLSDLGERHLRGTPRSEQKAEAAVA